LAGGWGWRRSGGGGDVKVQAARRAGFEAQEQEGGVDVGGAGPCDQEGFVLAGVGCAGDELEVDVGCVLVVSVDGDGGVKLDELGGAVNADAREERDKAGGGGC
jgi:hypothetical protein